MIQPISFEKRDSKKVCKLNKALYRLKQSRRLWYKFLKEALIKAGFIVMPYNKGVFIHLTKQLLLCCYIDDLLVAGPSTEIIDKVMNKASEGIKLQKMGKPSTFLGIQLEYNEGYNIKLYQTKYTELLLDRFNKNNIKMYDTPFEAGLKLEKSTYNATKEEINQFQKEISALLYLALKTRLDITYAVN